MVDSMGAGNGRVTRRGVVTGAAVGAGVMGLAACGSDESDPASSGGAGSGESAAPKASGGGGSDAVSVASSKVPVGGGFVDEANKVVVTQPKSGEFKAFSAVCTHEGCLVDAVKDNVIECPCHASKFDGSTGEVTGGPAEKALPAKTATVDGDQITIS